MQNASRLNTALKQLTPSERCRALETTCHFLTQRLRVSAPTRSVNNSLPKQCSPWLLEPALRIISDVVFLQGDLYSDAPASRNFRTLLCSLWPKIADALESAQFLTRSAEVTPPVAAELLAHQMCILSVLLQSTQFVSVTKDETHVFKLLLYAWCYQDHTAHPTLQFDTTTAMGRTCKYALQDQVPRWNDLCACDVTQLVEQTVARWAICLLREPPDMAALGDYPPILTWLITLPGAHVMFRNIPWSTLLTKTLKMCLCGRDSTSEMAHRRQDMIMAFSTLLYVELVNQDSLSIKNLIHAIRSGLLDVITGLIARSTAGRTLRDTPVVTDIVKGLLAVALPSLFRFASVFHPFILRYEQLDIRRLNDLVHAGPYAECWKFLCTEALAWIVYHRSAQFVVTRRRKAPACLKVRISSVAING